jgi:hypothetical protein
MIISTQEFLSLLDGETKEEMLNSINQALQAYMQNHKVYDKLDKQLEVHLSRVLSHGFDIKVTKNWAKTEYEIGPLAAEIIKAATNVIRHEAFALPLTEEIRKEMLNDVKEIITTEVRKEVSNVVREIMQDEEKEFIRAAIRGMIREASQNI